MAGRGNVGQMHWGPAPRRLAAVSPRAPARTPLCRSAAHSRPAADHYTAPSHAPAKQQLHGLLAGFCPEPRPEEQFAVNSNGRLLLLRLADILWLEADDYGVALHVGGETYLLDETLATVSAKLPPGRFLRLSPSALVNARQIKDLRRLCQGEWRVLLRNGRRLTFRHLRPHRQREAGVQCGRSASQPGSD
jgi:DNA-binding LytR/AlgR family response regulator